MALSFLWGERSTYHKTMVRRVHAYLKKKYSVVDFERSLVKDRITDAFAHDEKTKTWYLCEIKVNLGDLQKATTQIHDTVFRFRRAHKGSKVVPVIAFPSRLQKELVKLDNWGSFRDNCKNNGVAIWVIEQSSVRQVLGPNITSAKASATKKATTKQANDRKRTAMKTVNKKAAPKRVGAQKAVPVRTTLKKVVVKKTASKKPALKKIVAKKSAKGR